MKYFNETLTNDVFSFEQPVPDFSIEGLHFSGKKTGSYMDVSLSTNDRRYKVYLYNLKISIRV